MNKSLLLVFLISSISGSLTFAATARVATPPPQTITRTFCTPETDIIKNTNGNEILFNHVTQTFYYVNPKTEKLQPWFGIYNVLAKKNPAIAAFKTIIVLPEETTEKKITEEVGLTPSDEKDTFFYDENGFRCFGQFNTRKTVFTLFRIEKITQEALIEESTFQRLRKRASSLLSNVSDQANK